MSAVPAARDRAVPSGGRPPHAGVLAGVFAVLAVFGLATHALRATGALPDASGLVTDVVYIGLFALTAAACARRAVVDRPDRLAWAIAAAGVLLWGAGEASYRLLEPDPSAPYPRPAQALLALAFTLAAITIVLLSRRRLRGFDAGALLDGLVGGLAVSALAAVLLFPQGAEHAGRQAGPPAVFLLFDLAILAYVVTTLGLTGWRPGRCWALMCAGIALNTAGNVALVQATATGTFERGTLVDTLYATSALLLGAATWWPLRDADAGRARETGTRALLASSVFALAALALLVASAVSPGAIGPVAASFAAATIVALTARCTLAVRESRALLALSRLEALSDGLTGLANRRALMRELNDRLASGEPWTLAMYDLDGFKHYNDLFGHPAGDALLCRLAGRFSAALGAERTFRMGGDEFCALVPGDTDRAARPVAKGAAALAESGDGFSVASSYGAAELGAEASTAAEALQIADRRLYARKDDRRASAHQQSRAVLLQILTEREPGLTAHQDEVADLAGAVGRRLGLDADELRVLSRAAELHDVGKIAVPDAVLHKPGPLAPDELAFIRQHTVVGERILQAAPALAQVARLVRSSHERWDGSGYPDGLAGEQVPLGSRIILACDAYSAMTAERPYSAALPAAQAEAELLRCAGTHFDPRVVDALRAELASRAAAHRAAMAPPASLTERRARRAS
ncbi:MAG: diguanylate cyclase [Solirubrobacteraceae bacterium]